MFLLSKLIEICISCPWNLIVTVKLRSRDLKVKLGSKQVKMHIIRCVLTSWTRWDQARICISLLFEVINKKYVTSSVLMWPWCGSLKPKLTQVTFIGLACMIESWYDLGVVAVEMWSNQHKASQITAGPSNITSRMTSSWLGDLTWPRVVPGLKGCWIE